MTVTTSVAYKISEWVCNAAIADAKDEGWHDAYLLIWDEVIAACANETARSVTSVDLSSLGDDYVLPEAIPWAAIGSAVNMSVQQLGSTSSTTPLWMNFGSNAQASAAVVAGVGTHTAS